MKSIIKKLNLLKTIIIAEAGVNHNGNIELAKQMVDVAAGAGADYVKFQTFKAENLVSTKAKTAPYQQQNTEESTQLEMLKKLELNKEAHLQLLNYAALRKIGFLSTAFDDESLDLLIQLNLDILKIPSGEITNLPYLQKVGSLDKKVILSTGMATLEEVKIAIQTLTEAGTSKENLIVLQCNTAYPTPAQDVNLRGMLTMQQEFKVKVGFSDHTIGFIAAIAAVAMGAVCIEKHFTIDRTLPGPDQKASLDPEELKTFIKFIRETEILLGSPEKKPTPSEFPNLSAARKSIHLRHFCNVGQILSEKDLIIKRPGNGIAPGSFSQIIGKKLIHDLPADHVLTWADLV